PGPLPFRRGSRGMTAPRGHPWIPQGISLQREETDADCAENTKARRGSMSQLVHGNLTLDTSGVRGLVMGTATLLVSDPDGEVVSIGIEVEVLHPDGTRTHLSPPPTEMPAAGHYAWDVPLDAHDSIRAQPVVTLVDGEVLRPAALTFGVRAPLGERLDMEVEPVQDDTHFGLVLRIRDLDGRVTEVEFATQEQGSGWSAWAPGQNENGSVLRDFAGTP